MKETELYLETIKIPYNQLDNLDLKILSITIKDFVLGNSETILPHYLEKLKKLEILDLTGIIISDEILNNEICKLNKLKELHLLCAGISKIPDGISNLINLKKIVFGFNNLRNLPMEFKFLINLKELNLNDNNFEEIPHIFKEMANLKEIWLKNNPINENDKNLLTPWSSLDKSDKDVLRLFQSSQPPLFSTSFEEALPNILHNKERMGNPLTIEEKFILGKHRALKGLNKKNKG